MSTLFEVPALSPGHRYIKATLLRLRRFVNSFVARLLATRERQALRFMLKKLGARKKDIGLRRSGVRADVFGLMVAGSPGHKHSPDGGM